MDNKYLGQKPKDETERNDIQLYIPSLYYGTDEIFCY